MILSFVWNLRLLLYPMEKSGHQTEREAKVQSHFCSEDNGPHFPSLHLMTLLCCEKWWKVVSRMKEAVQLWNGHQGHWQINLWFKFGWKWGRQDGTGCSDRDVEQPTPCSSWLSKLQLFTTCAQRWAAWCCDFKKLAAIMKLWPGASEWRLSAGLVCCTGLEKRPQPQLTE